MTATEPTRATMPRTVPVQCPKAPLLHSHLEGVQTRAGHCYRRIDGTWTCRYCQAPVPR